MSRGRIGVPLLTADREIKVVAPPANMILLHRWIANLRMCTAIGRTSDRNNNYRCVSTGPGASGGYLDTTRFCNGSFADPQRTTTTDLSGTNASIAYSNAQVPTARDTLPG